MPLFFRNHILINKRTEILSYTSNQSGRSKIKPRTDIDRNQHGNSIKNQFEIAVNNFHHGEDNEFVYLVFKSPLNFLLDLDKLDKSQCVLCTYKIISSTDIKIAGDYYEAIVKLNKKAISIFLKKIEQYINVNTLKGNPKNNSLIANIEEIKSAALESFWQDLQTPFLASNDIIWWEVWIIKEDLDITNDPLLPFYDLLNNANIQIKDQILKFPEHWIYLMKGSSIQLSNSLLYVDNLAEIRKPRETAEFFTYLDIEEQNEWINDLVIRITNNTQNSIIATCLLDTGLNMNNPLFTNLIEERNLDAVKPNWTKADTAPNGHGTPMAGLLLFGDLSELLTLNDSVIINHHLESIKLIEGRDPHNPQLYGSITQEAIARSEILNPGFKRQICMAITSEEFVHYGRPSSWSSAIDQSIFGNTDERNQNFLFFVSAGNLPENEIINFPLSNDNFSIQDPGQSFNCITVGAYTVKDNIDLQSFPGATLLSSYGGMCGSNSTSISWHDEWSRKPDIVMEGGNYGLHNGGLISPDSLKLLTTGKGGGNKSWLAISGDTSAATALATKFSAELYYHYSNYWPETIRALIIHSADWTPSMLGGRDITALDFKEKEKLISRVGYGIPNMEKAKYSANNSLSLILERTIQPYKIENSKIQTKEFHLFDLPWPTDVLQQLSDINVKFKITLSYFIEPNPGNKRYDLAASYRSHGLRFKMIDSNESIDAFKARISKDMRDENYISEGSERWILGNKIRDKGSIHKDIWEGQAAALALRNKIAVYPVGGWWKSRKKHLKYENAVRYSLIMTIESPVDDISVDIFTPVFNQIAVEL